MYQSRPFSTSKFIQIYSKVPRLCVDLVIKGREGILLTYRKIDPKNVWHFPGGTVYYRESLINAAKRVAKQELGLDIKIIKEIGTIDFATNKETFSHAVSVVFLAKITSGSIILDDQASDFGFFKKIPEQMYLPHGKFLKKYFNFK
jgi:ADP-ribose pyrophosphatase YjhB (NUDIX family)